MSLRNQTSSTYPFLKEVTTVSISDTGETISPIKDSIEDMARDEFEFGLGRM